MSTRSVVSSLHEEEHAPQQPQAQGKHTPQQPQSWEKHTPQQAHPQAEDTATSSEPPPPVYTRTEEIPIASQPARNNAAQPTPQMTYQAPTTFQSNMPVTLLTQLSSNSAPVCCPACRQCEMTRIEHESGGMTFVWAAAGCLICAIPLACVPFCIDSTKNVDHFCGKCGKKLATWHRSGRVEVWAHEGGQVGVRGREEK